MKLSDIFRSISTTLQKPFATTKNNVVSEDNVKARLDDIKWDLTTTDGIYNQLSEKQAADLYSRVINRCKMEPLITQALGKPIIDFILNIDKQLSGRAKSQGFFRSVNVTSRAMITMLESLQSHIDIVFVNKEDVIIGDTQISHGLFLGAMETANIYSMLNGYLFAIFSHILSVTPSTDTLPKYMGEYVTKHSELYFELINTAMNATSGMNIIGIISNIKKKGVDFKLADSNVIKNNLIDPMTLMGVAVFATFVTGLANISWFGEKYTDIRHSYYEWKKNRKKWLENHVANIRMNLENIDINDPEYVKTIKIVTYYDDKIASLDKSLQSYYNE